MIKDLQLYDWVLLNSVPVQVDTITKQSVGYRGDYFEPNAIELSDEILKANGFEFGLTTEQEDFCAMHASCGVSAEKSWVKEDGGAEYSISWIDGYATVSNLKDSRYDGKCEFVHELQHALRLCGLNKLADNFKIE